MTVIRFTKDRQTQFRVGLVVFSYGGMVRDDLLLWFADVYGRLLADDRVHSIAKWKVNETPTDMARNKAVQEAKEFKVDYLLMLDNDMMNDLYLVAPAHQYSAYSPPPANQVVEFWKSSWNFILERRRERALAAVAAPYCGPPPNELVYVNEFKNLESHPVDPQFHLGTIGREDASRRRGFEKVASTPTGCLLIDMRCFDLIQPPYFHYEYEDATCSKKISTEDTVCTRNLVMAGAEMWVNWEAWSGHWKEKLVGKPSPITPDEVADSIKVSLGFSTGKLGPFIGK